MTHPVMRDANRAGRDGDDSPRAVRAGQCPRCRKAYQPGVTAPHHKSRDHILPVERGGGMFGGGGRVKGVRNILIMCQECNSLRAEAGHCWGALACAADIAGLHGISVRTIMRRWRFGWWRNETAMKVPAANKGGGSVSHPVAKADAERWLVPEGPADQGRRAKNDEAIQLGMAVNKIGADEFIWPADTAAKRVWNLATLAKAGYDGPTPSDLREVSPDQGVTTMVIPSDRIGSAEISPE